MISSPRYPAAYLINPSEMGRCSVDVSEAVCDPVSDFPTSFSIAFISDKENKKRTHDLARMIVLWDGRRAARVHLWSRSRTQPCSSRCSGGALPDGARRYDAIVNAIHNRCELLRELGEPTAEFNAHINPNFNEE